MEKCEIMKHVFGGGRNGPDHPRDIGVPDFTEEVRDRQITRISLLHPDLGQDLFLHGVHDGRGFIERSERDGIIYWKAFVIRLTQFVPDLLKITGKFRSIPAF